MTDKHTPGPWTVRMDRRDRFNRTIDRGATGDYLYVQFGNGSGFTPRGEIDNRMDADADLIAAAPLMLDALREARESLLRCGEEPGWAAGNWAPKRHYTTGGMWDRLDAAIAAATGEAADRG